MKRIAFACLAACWGARFILRGESLTVWPFLAGAAVLLAMRCCRLVRSERLYAVWRTLALVLLVFVVFALRTDAVCRQWRLAERWTMARSAVQATLVRPMVRADWQGFDDETVWHRGRFRIETPGRSMDVQLTLPERLACGTVVCIPGEALRPGQPRQGSGQLDVRAWMHAAGIRLQGRLQEGGYESKGPSRTPCLEMRMGRRQESFFSRMDAVFGRDAPLVRGMVFGETAGLSDDLQTRLQRLGIRHLMAVSGFHVGIVYGLALLVCAATGLRGWPRCLFLTGWLAGFTVLTGGSASTCRAALVLSLYGVMERLQREKSFAGTLCLSALILVFWRPYTVLDLGFALSYSAAFGMAVLAPLCRDLLGSTPLGIGAAAWLGALPAASVFHAASLWGIALTPLFSLFLVVVLPCVLCAFCCPVDALGDMMLHGCVPFVRALRASIEGVSGWGPMEAISRALVFRMPKLPVARGILYASSLGLLAWMHARAEDRMPMHRRVLCAVAVVCLVMLLAQPVSVRGLEVTFVNVGQGDCIWIGYRDFDMLVDAGTEQAGRRAVVPFLESRNIRSLDLIVVTHLDSDHSGGLPAVLDHVQVGRVWFSTESQKDLQAEEQGILSTLKKRKIPYGYHAAHERHRIDALEVEVLGPPPDSARRSANEGSLVLRVRMGGLVLDLTGDTEGETLKGLDLAAPEEATVVCKAPHHGSKSALVPAAFADQHADVVIVSCGRNNRYGHPHPDVLAYWTGRGVILCRTDEDGEIRLRYWRERLRIVRGMDLWYTV